jgi:hypothetical protein
MMGLSTLLFEKTNVTLLKNKLGVGDGNGIRLV